MSPVGRGRKTHPELVEQLAALQESRKPAEALSSECGRKPLEVRLWAGAGRGQKAVALRYFMSLARKDISRRLNFAVRQVEIKSLLARAHSVGDISKLDILSGKLLDGH